MTPIVAEEFGNRFTEPSVFVVAILASRTFWEKATILHEQAHKPEGTKQSPEYSRHYYDMFCLAKSETKTEAFADLHLLETVAKHKIDCYPRGWAKYEEARPGTLRLMPPEHVEREIRKNYEEAEPMYFGERPSFDEILATLAKLEEEINSLSWPPAQGDEAGEGVSLG